ncbi:vitamin B12 dependent methionine synthase [candidate division KSB1 bacterium]|nr:vitamin B12 dependent methionine synthase [candidate division KSB1 bacterium]
MNILDNIDFSPNAETMRKQAHIAAASEDETELLKLIELSKNIGRPKAAYTVSYVTERNEDTLQIDDVTFKSRTLALHLKEVERVFPYVATCGHEMDEEYKDDGDMLKAFWWDLIKQSMLDTANTALHEHLENTYRLGKTASMQPGSADVAVWPIEQQKALFALLGDVEENLGVHLTESCLMIPNKTVSGIYFPTETDFRSCEVCRRDNCPSRRVAFNEELWQAIHHA